MGDTNTFNAKLPRAGEREIVAAFGREQAPVIGSDVCQTHGPFDLVFVDGLHFDDAVHGDLRLAAEHLAPGGVFIFDCWYGPAVLIRKAPTFTMS